MITISNVENIGGDFEPVDKGTYEVKIKSAVNKTAASGNPMIKLEVEITNHEVWEGRLLWDNLVLIPQVAWKIAEVCTSCGIQFEFNEATKNLEFDNEALQDAIGVVQVEMKAGKTRDAETGLLEDTGKLQSYIKRWLPQDK